MTRDADGWFEVEHDCGAGTRYRYRVEPPGGGDAMLVPDPASRAQAGDVHDAERRRRPARLRVDERRRGTGGRGARRSSTSSTPASPAASTASASCCPQLAAARRHGGRADADRRLHRHAQLGLRRRAAVRARRDATARPTIAEGAGRRGARPRADGLPRRRLQPLRSGRQLPRRLRRRVLPRRRARRRGVARSTSAAPRCATSSATTRCTGSRSIASTGCGFDAVHAIVPQDWLDGPRRVRHPRRSRAVTSTSCSRTKATRRTCSGPSAASAAASTRSGTTTAITSCTCC